MGVGWVHSSSGHASENLDPQFRATGRDVNGGYAEYLTVPADYAYSIPACFSDVEAAPLLRTARSATGLRLAHIQNGDLLGLTGFGGSGHLVLQLARHLYPRSRIFVFARDEKTREFALQLGADWSGDTTERAPDRLHAIIDTTPAWRPVVEALAQLRPGGRLVINAIRKEAGDQDALLKLSYHEHLWMEKELKTVANITHFDIREFLPLAAGDPHSARGRNLSPGRRQPRGADRIETRGSSRCEGIGRVVLRSCRTRATSKRATQDVRLLPVTPLASAPTTTEPTGVRNSPTDAATRTISRLPVFRAIH